MDDNCQKSSYFLGFGRNFPHKLSTSAWVLDTEENEKISSENM
jgi:hypothetical protein